MTTQNTPQKSESTSVPAPSAKSLFQKEEVQKKFQELLGKRSAAFITSVLQIVSQNQLLAKADPNSIYHAAATAATLDLPLNNNLGFAYIVPYNQKQPDNTYKQVAQFQLGYKGFVQLAQRSGQFETISSSPIYEGQLTGTNPLTGFVFDFDKKSSDKVIGYAAYFKLNNGFHKTLFMTVEEMRSHGEKYSQTFKKGFGMWKDNFDAMASKTVLKLLLSKYAPLSIEMQTAVKVDQAVISDHETEDVIYVDHEEVRVDKEAERLQLMIKDCQTLDELELLRSSHPDMFPEIFEERKNQLSKKK